MVAARTRSALTFAVCLVLSFNHCFYCTGQAALKGSCAKVDITPPLGITLIGSRGKPSDAIMDDLYAKALVLSDGSQTIAIISADLLYTPLEEITDPVRTLVNKNAGIPKENIMVCATHTHSGPEAFTRLKVPNEGRLEASQVDQAYLSVLVRKLADSAVMASRNMRDVRIGTAKGSLPEVLYNRRPTTGDGLARITFTIPAQVAATRKVTTSADGIVRVEFTLPPEEPHLTFGPIDPDVFTLRVEDVNGGVIGSLVRFGCHPVCIYPSLSTTISADYPAFATRVVERVEGGICLFTLGLAGNAVPFQRGPQACRQIGSALGAEAVKRLQLTATIGDVAITSVRREVVLPVKQPGPGGGSPTGDIPQSITTEVQVLKLGSTCILGLPGEVLVEVGQEIKRRADVKDLFIITLANDVVGYICHSRAYEEGGYEPESGTYLAKGAGEVLIEQAVSLIHQIMQTQ
jgi:hypothetical protein